MVTNVKQLVNLYYKNYLYFTKATPHMTATSLPVPSLPKQPLTSLFFAFAAIILTACSNSESIETFSNYNSIIDFESFETNVSSSASEIINYLPLGDSNINISCSSSEFMETFSDDDSIIIFEPFETNVSSASEITDYLPLDDSEYPYAGIPRIVIETDNFREIRNRETEIPAKLQIWGEKTPESEIISLSIRGRGNTSWTDMPKKSYKIEFINKQAMLGMPEDRDWALIANYADKTLLKNFITYKLSSWLDADYTPYCKFVELYINRLYLGAYLITETIKKNRLHFVDDDSFLAEYDIHYKEKNQVIFLEESQKPVSVHYPKAASPTTLNILKEHLDSLNALIKNGQLDPGSLNKWIDLDSYFLFYWVQEFSENRDGNFDTSVFFTWTIGEPLKMGPLWDFDLAYNGHPNTLTQDPEKWFIRNYYWNYYLFKDSLFKSDAYSYWKKHRDVFEKTIDSLYVYCDKISGVAKNNFKRWPILSDTNSRFHQESFTSHKAAVEALASWIDKRIQWIDQKVE